MKERIFIRYFCIKLFLINKIYKIIYLESFEFYIVKYLINLDIPDILFFFKWSKSYHFKQLDINN